MAQPAQLADVFAQLKAIIEPFAAWLKVEADTASGYSLNTPYVEQWKKELFFGAVQIKKNYVSYHLMPVYMYPDLLEGIAPALQKRMQGKSCFNFTALDPALLAELAQLIERGFERMRQEYGIA